jgi:hypothetical protein
MVFDLQGLHGAEGVQPDGEVDEVNPGTGSPAAVDQRLGQVQAGRRGGRRVCSIGEDGLVALGVA